MPPVQPRRVQLREVLPWYTCLPADWAASCNTCMPTKGGPSAQLQTGQHQDHAAPAKPGCSCPCLQPPPPMLMGTPEPIAAPQPGASQAELASPESPPIRLSPTSSAMSGTGIATIVGVGVPLAACAGEDRLALSTWHALVVPLSLEATIPSCRLAQMGRSKPSVR